jgi:RNA polymerase subunit RPABC4/transcription elongation factor Spt4
MKKIVKKRVKCSCPACNTVQLVEYSPILSGTMKCKKCTAEFLAVPARPKSQTNQMRGVQKQFVVCKDCGRDISSKAERCPSCGAPTASVRAKQHMRRHMIKRKKWRGKICAAVLSAAAVILIVGLGFLHVITGSNLENPRIVAKGSFGYAETFINIDKITGMPWVFAKSKYPIGCKVLQDKGHIETDEAFERRIKRQFARLHQ